LANVPKFAQNEKDNGHGVMKFYFHISPMSNFPSYLDPLRYSSIFLHKEPNELLDGKDDEHHKPNNFLKSKNILKNIKENSFVSN
jgi:hypothetical protein